MTKDEVLSALREVYCRLGTTPHGVGVVAVRLIPEGTDPFKNCDPFGDVVEIPESELEAYDAPQEAKQLVRDFCALQGGVYFVPSYGIDAIDKSYYLNHSSDPNLITHDQGETFVALRDIKAGEELTANYDQYQELRQKFRERAG